MSSGAPGGFDAQGAGTTLGCATVRTARDGRELWRFADAEDRRIERLSRLGRRGVFGFVESGRDEHGHWLLRAAGVPSLREAIQQRRGPWPFREVLELAVELARALAACEKQEMLPGAVTPDQIALTAESRFGHVRADGLLGELAGAPAPAGAPLAQRVPARWLPPEQAGSEIWDAAANRYVLGLIVYRLLSGEHAFKAQGLRLGFEEQRSAGAPPFAGEVARTLPPGLQSLCLQLLHPDPAQRPPSARTIERRLRVFLDAAEGAAVAAPLAAPPRAALEPQLSPSSTANEQPVSVNVAAAGARHAARRRRRTAAGVPLLAAVALAAWAVFSAPSGPTRPAVPLDQQPLAAQRTQSGDCAQCHTRQVAEWRRSVMAHSARSPLFQALEMLIQEQVGRSTECPDGAGILRAVDPDTACRDPESGLPVTGSGGELWCVNCHAPAQNLNVSMPAWDATALGRRSRRPLSDLLPEAALEGIGCAFCHQTVGPAHPTRGGYQGNPSWRSSSSGRIFSSRPEDGTGRFGIANSGYELDASRFLLRQLAEDEPAVHARTPPDVRAYRASSEFCGTCHDVRLFGTDVLGGRAGEHFKRLRNAYSEWRAWADSESRQGRTPASCQGCHMSTFPGVCVADEPPQRAPREPARSTALTRVCPPGTRFEPRAPYAFARGHVADNSSVPRALYSHYFSGVDLPLAPEFDRALLDDSTLDSAGTPLGARQRRDLLLASSVRLGLGEAAARGARLEVPVTLENIGAGHRVPAGFSQERELWVELRVSDGQGRVIYEVGRVESPTSDLLDKRFLRVNVGDSLLDARGRPLGMFGADVADGPDAPDWIEERASGGARAEAYRGQGLINFQNGFLRCVTCIGRIDAEGRCQPLPGQERARGDRFADGDYDPETGACRSNLFGDNALFETYFPVGALDASRGILKAPDAIIDTRSLAPGVPKTYTYTLNVPAARAPFRIEARLLFRAFPPFLLRAFIAYERQREMRGHRPSGPLMSEAALDRLDIVELARASRVVP